MFDFTKPNIEILEISEDSVLVVSYVNHWNEATAQP